MFFMELVHVHIPGKSVRFPEVYAEGNLVSLVGDGVSGYTLSFDSKDILILFYYFSIHRVAFVTAHGTVPVGKSLSSLEFVGSQRTVLAQLSGRAFDRFKRGVYLLKAREPRFYTLDWVFWLRFASLMRSGMNSQSNVRRLVDMFRKEE